METVYAETTPGRIRVLPEKVANQIAAGEVVERPASIIKELIENSVDAGASHIRVSIRNGGKSTIGVIDDGVGMNRDDSLLCLERHATSKIRGHEDLAAIATMGFRGEAIPSIASVCRMILATSPAGAEAGTEIALEGGKLQQIRDCAPVLGTSITVNSLFYNVPARRKFLKSESVEAGHCHESVLRQALGAPAVGFTFTRDGKRIFDVPSAASGVDGLAGRISALFGEKAMAPLIRVDHSFDGMKVTGFISRPGGGRAARDMQYVYVNGRYMRDKIIIYAVNEAYRSLLPRGIHPYLFLYIEVPPEGVDVNVSPTKSEARFTDNSAVINLVRGGLSLALEERSTTSGNPSVHSAAFFAPSAGPYVPPRRMDLRETVAPLAPYPGAPYSGAGAVDGGVPFVIPGRAEAGHSTPEDIAKEARPLEAGLDIPENARVVGQVFRTFILLEAGERLFLVDQHTAHERINYEALCVRYREGKVDSQELLFPLPLELTAPRADLLRRIMGWLEKLGFSLEEFGSNDFNIRAVPRLIAGADHAAVILDALEKASGMEERSGFDEMLEPVISSMACRASVMAGERLDVREMESLVRRLDQCRLPYTCPHGRPVALSISRDDLYRGFLRK
ncbi:MAG: DNA mismatch repair endonuclease MutL [Nitrospinota bacterium]|nr:DNA mismatch repair endonuclease MutL [Nitrospinota bacterium]